MRPVIIESPYATNNYHSQEEHERYLERCILDCIRRDETSYASHKQITGALDDANAEEREAGIRLGFEMAKFITGVTIVVYLDYGLSSGMSRGINEHLRAGREVEFRQIGKNP